MKKINWEIFFGDSSSEESLMLFAFRKLTFKQFFKNCSYSKERKKIIRTLKIKGYKKSRRSARRALKSRGFEKDLLDI